MIERELSEEELDGVIAGVPVNKGTIIGDEITLEQLDQIKAGLANFRLGHEENSKADTYSDKKEALLKEKAELEKMSHASSPDDTGELSMEEIDKLTSGRRM